MRVFKILLYVCCFTTCLPAVIGSDNVGYEVTGIVVNEHGIPMSGVEIRRYFNGTINAVTDKNGMFLLAINEDTDHNCCVAIFSVAGYKQVTKALQKGTGKIMVTMPSNENVWSPPLCNDVTLSNKSNLLGWDLKISLDQKAQVEKLPGSPYSDIVQIKIGFESKLKSEYQWMELTTGSRWLYVIPYKTLLLSHNNEERVIKGNDYYYEFVDSTGNTYINDSLKPLGMDYRGVDENGKKWRNIGFRLQTIIYENASPEAAEYFDKIVDSICVDPFRVINGDRNRLSGIPDFWN